MKCSKINVRRDRFIKLIVGLLLFVLTAALLIAQDENSQEAPTFRSQANVVLVPVLVRDATGHAVYGLQAKDFILEDDGVQQTVQLDDETQADPLAVVVAVQIGRSAPREFQRIRGLNSMLGQILDQPQAEIAIVEFDSQI